MEWDEKVIQIINWSSTDALLIALTNHGNIFIGHPSVNRLTPNKIIWTKIDNPS